MMEVATLEELIQYGKTLMELPSLKEMYLTECTGCCSGGAKLGHNSSYRLFATDQRTRNYLSAIPKFTEYDRHTPHPDTGLNERILIVKAYHQQVRIADLIAREITLGKNGAIDISKQEDIPQGAIIWRLK